jgi:sensor c-di-GMP phosphodiesterase-like protein
VPIKDPLILFRRNRLSGFGRVVAAYRRQRSKYSLTNTVIMRKLLLLLLILVTSAIITSCNDSTASATEKTEINKMDSVSQSVEDSTKKLEDQTRKVEDALEKLDKEFQSDNQNK